MDVDAKTHIRRLLEKATKRSIPDEMWLDLNSLGYVDDAITRAGWGNLVRETRRLLRYVELGARSGAVKRQPTASRRAPIRARGAAFSALVARRMETLGKLTGFRAYWGGGRLESDEAIERVQTPGWTLVDLKYLWSGDGRRPFRSTDAEFIRHHQSRVASAEPEVRHNFEGTRLAVDLEWGSEHRTHSFWHNDGADTVVSIAVPGAELIYVLASPLSIVGGLARLANELQREAPWTQEDAAWFVLTGEPPPIAPLLMGIERGTGWAFRRAVVKLEVEPWVPHDVVLAAYRQAQREALPGANRSISERSAELARFVAADGLNLSVRDQMRRWNERHPEWPERDPRNFQSRAKRVASLVASGPRPTRVQTPIATATSGHVRSTSPSSRRR